MLSKYVSLGNRVEISYLKDKNFSKTYYSQVDEIVSEKEVYLYSPISYGILVKLPLNKVYSFTFITDTGIYFASGKVKKYVKNDDIALMLVELVSNLTKIQRREFFRFKCLISFKFTKVNVEEEGRIDQEYYQFDTLEDGVIKDISGGGIRFVSNASMEKNDVIQSIITLSGSYIVAIGKILHMQSMDDFTYKYEYRVKFSDLSKLDQEKIVQYIFDEQRKVLQKERNSGFLI